MIVDDVIAQINATDTVLDGAIVYVASVPQLIAAAVQQAIAGGATAAQLQPLTDLTATLKSKSDSLVAALAANTPSPAPTPVQKKAAKG